MTDRPSSELPRLPALALLLAIAGMMQPITAHAQSNVAQAAYATAEAAEKEAGSLRNQWTATETSLGEARTAAGQGDFDRAITAAWQAEALAKASISRATHEKQAWKALEIR